MLCYWQSSIRNSDLIQQFEITRQQAYNDLKNYQQLYPNQLVQAQDKRYSFSTDALLHHFSGEVEPYLDWLLTQNFSAAVNRSSQPIAHALVLPTRQVCRHTIATLTDAIKNKHRIEVGYVSLSNPEQDGRIFHPHSFIKTGLRWHVRGYCEKSAGYRDLVLSRFRGEAECLGASHHPVEDDLAWQTPITLIFAPDPRLTAAQQEVLAQDYQMEGGQLLIKTRAALAQYLLKEMQVNTKFLEGTPEAQQLVLVNKNDIKPWLFGD
ncbi:transcriptional regulator [Oceanospirillum multiglobuliferum]|uniref:Transcriptional regulator n=2 Tax=Oceanospirillum multiglobuliferum TaxID=64969 RepID=A0A1V4T3D8_9GAMM|nr:transcriptional regulator [Oceanospirillum multiglobuliferum]